MKRILALCLFLMLLLTACAANAKETDSDASATPVPHNLSFPISNNLSFIEDDIPTEPVFIPAPEVPVAPRTIDPTRPMVALTYDDGPHKTCTDQILDILEQYHAKATFFEVGINLSQAPDAVRREESLGCEVASHSYRHANLGSMTAEAIKQDTQAAEDLFTEVLGHQTTLLRPPYGSFNDAVKTSTNHSLVTWTIDTLDWKTKNTDKIVEVVKTSEKLDGQVILFHSLYDTSVEATRILVPWLQEQGYQLVTVSELIALRFGDRIEPNRSYNYSYFLSKVPEQPAALSSQDIQNQVLTEAEVELKDQTPVTIKLVMTQGRHLTMDNQIAHLGAGYDAENNLGKCELQVWKDDSTMLSSLPLTNRDGGEELLFHADTFPLSVDDYNQDGMPDFTLGQWLNDYSNAYTIFTLDEDGSISRLSENFGITSSDAVEKGPYSAPLQKSKEGIRTFVYDSNEKGYWQQDYRWNESTFVLNS